MIKEGIDMYYDVQVKTSRATIFRRVPVDTHFRDDGCLAHGYQAWLSRPVYSNTAHLNTSTVMYKQVQGAPDQVAAGRR